jgi:RNA polymerase sigma-70 factor (ECF subfamily)
MSENISDLELVTRLKKREGEAVGILVSQYADRLYNYAYYRSSDHHLAEDIASETLAKIIEKIDTYEQRDVPFKAWVFRIAHNILVNHLRQLKKHNSVPLEQADWASENASGDWGAADGGDMASQLADRQELQQAIAALADDQRSVFILRFIEGFELEQVALMLEKSVVSIKSLQFRAVRNLRKALEQSRGIGVNGE